VNLLGEQGQGLGATTTAADGTYRFTGLGARTFKLEFVPSAPHVSVPQDRGADDAVDSDPDRTTGRTGPISVSPATDLTGWDGGFYTPATLSGRTWADEAADGIRQAGDRDLGGVAVRLVGPEGVVSSVTAAEGTYVFTGLAPGAYTAEFTAPPSLFFSPQDQGADDTIDSDPQPASGRTSVISLGAGSSFGNVDAGFFQKASVSGLVWKDVDEDGLRDADEPGLAGIPMRLAGPGAAPVASATSDAGGRYRFSDVVPGDYALEFAAPEGFALTMADQGADDTVDSDAFPGPGRTSLLPVRSGASTVADAGLFNPPTRITSSPLPGDTDVALTRETIFRFSNPLEASATVGPDLLFAEHGGQRLAGRIRLSPDRRTLTFFYDRTLPASARVRVTLLAGSLRDAFGHALEGDGDGRAGGTSRIDFDTVTLTTLEGTSVCGRVFASELAPGDSGTSVNVPLEAVILTVDGAETILRTTTDRLGSFCLDPAPVGRFFVHIPTGAPPSTRSRQRLLPGGGQAVGIDGGSADDAPGHL